MYKIEKFKLNLTIISKYKTFTLKFGITTYSSITQSCKHIIFLELLSNSNYIFWHNIEINIYSWHKN